MKENNHVAQRVQKRAKEEEEQEQKAGFKSEEHFKGLSLPLPVEEKISQMRIGIIKTCWNESLVNSLSGSCREELLKAKVMPSNIVEVSVPGSFELPFAAQRMALSRKVDAIICFGVLLKGETNHYDNVAQSVAQGLMQVQLSTNVPVVYGVLNCMNMGQAKERYCHYLDVLYHYCCYACLNFRFCSYSG
jgi:6,7-dimethyl-8-ribityllumazine synthase